MIYLFYFIMFLGILNFFYKKRTFDFFSIAFISAMIYFFPGFVGYVGIEKINMTEPISVYTYTVVILVVLSLILTSLMFDTTKKKEISFIFLEKNSSYLAEAALIIGISSFVILYMTQGSMLFTAGKASLAENYSRWSILYQSGISLATILFFIQKKYKFAIFSLLVLSINIYIGYRSTFVITIISLLTIYLNKKGPIRFIRYAKIIFIAFIGLMFLLVAKVLLPTFKYAIITGDYNYFLNYISDLGNVFRIAILNAEPFVTMWTLNTIINNNFETSATELLGLLALLIPFGSEIGIQGRTFNSLFQPILFSWANYGVGSNIWAQFYSIGGFFVLSIFLLIYNFFLYLASQALLIRSSYLKAVFAIMSSYWAFYIHRNDIGFQITLERRVIIIYIFSLILSIVIYNFFPKKRKSK